MYYWEEICEFYIFRTKYHVINQKWYGYVFYMNIWDLKHLWLTRESYKIKNSSILHCYADWCEPCRELSPKLEGKAVEAEGKWALGRLNIDEMYDFS